VVLVVALGGATGYVLNARGELAAAKAAQPARRTGGDAATVAAGPHLVFRNTALGAGYGMVALVPLSAPAGPRVLTRAACDRVYASRNQALCLAANRGITTTYKAQLLGADWSPKRNLPLSGLPSRARLSRDGSLAATTTFVYGDSYTSPGQFSTQTLVTRTDGTQLGNIEQFELVVDGRVVSARDKNLWGVTFADNDAFYATAASGGKTWLVRGSLSARRVTALREDAECPSLSPDGTRIAFKKHGDLPAGHWRLAVYEVGSRKETLLAETRSVDDQVEWLDNGTVLYGLPRTSGAGAATNDIWAVPADGSGASRVLVHDAWSPAVVR
jgi:WD40-like Beta Propeller Repeat